MIQSLPYFVDKHQEITELLTQLRDGDPGARDRLIPLVYDDLRRIAASHLRRLHGVQTMESAALVHETYLRLVERSEQVNWQNRAHFFGVASTAMRQILVDYARAKACSKRGGGLRRVSFDQELVIGEDRLEDILAVDELLTQLSQLDKRQSRVFEMHFFGGLSQAEIAEALNVSVRTVKRDWSLVRAWMKSRLHR